jgi:Lrp/AsnC family leucine-responsive transcriptional regulator
VLWITDAFSVRVSAWQQIALLRTKCIFLAYSANIFLNTNILMTLDRYDRQILEILQTDGRINNQDLADRIGLSPSPCLRRVRALEESGLIVGYRALLDARKLGLTLMALVHISMDQHTPERFANFEGSVSVLPEVLECLLITGQDADYQLKVMVRDMDHYQTLLLDKLTRITGVTGVHSSFVLRRVVDKTALALS